MIESLAISSLVCFVTAWIVNSLLLSLLIFRPPAQLYSFKGITAAFIAFDLIFSLAYAIIVPLWHSMGDGFTMLIPVGFTSTLPPAAFLARLIRPSFAVWHAGMMSTSFLVAGTFIYRYAIICNKVGVRRFFKRPSIIIIICLSACCCLAHGIIPNFVLSANHKLTDLANEQWSAFYGLNFSMTYFQGVDLLDPDDSLRIFASFAISGVFQVSFFILIIIVFYTGRAILLVRTTRSELAIRYSTTSRRLRELQQQTFRMLAISPTLFLYIPPVIDAASVMFGFQLPFSVCIAKAVLVFLFPIANPLVIIAFTKEYRSIILRKSSYRKTTSAIPSITAKAWPSFTVGAGYIAYK